MCDLFFNTSKKKNLWEIKVDMANKTKPIILCWASGKVVLQYLETLSVRFIYKMNKTNGRQTKSA